MKKLIAAALSIVLMGGVVASQYTEPTVCYQICAEHTVSGSFMFVKITNATDRYQSCNIVATNGAYYSFDVYPRSTSRFFRINDVRATYQWTCFPIAG